MHGLQATYPQGVPRWQRRINTHIRDILDWHELEKLLQQEELFLEHVALHQHGESDAKYTILNEVDTFERALVR